MKEFKIQVKGMECTGCENRIQNAIRQLHPIELVKADYNTGIVTVITEEALLSTIQEKIENLGFQIVGE